MKPGTAANVSLVLALLVWPCVALGFINMVGDPVTVHHDPQEIARFNAYFRAGLYTLVAGVVALPGALWFSGRAWREARRRALLALLICLAPPLVYVAQTLANPH